MTRPILPRFPLHEKLIDLMKDIDMGAFAALGNKVLTGPFKGMEISEQVVWNDGNNGAKLIGSYEEELHEAFEKAISRAPKTIVNLGSAEGYYAIGLARRLPEATVHAIDLDSKSLNLCKYYADKNLLNGQLKTHLADDNDSDLYIQGEWPRLYIVDIEGAEMERIDPELHPSLIKSDMIIECHEIFKREAIIKRFEKTHDIDIIEQRMPDFDKFPFLKDYAFIVQVLAILDKRGGTISWLACWVKDEQSVTTQDGLAGKSP